MFSHLFRITQCLNVRAQIWTYVCLISEPELLFILLSKVQEINYELCEICPCSTYSAKIQDQVLEHIHKMEKKNKDKLEKTLGGGTYNHNNQRMWSPCLHVSPSYSGTMHSCVSLLLSQWVSQLSKSATKQDKNEGHTQENGNHHLIEHPLYAKHFLMSTLTVSSSELHSKKNGLLAPLRVILFVTRNDSCLPKGVEAASQGAGKDRPGAGSLPQPYALRLRGRNEKRESPIHPTWMPNRLSGWRKAYLTWNSDSRIQRPL